MSRTWESAEIGSMERQGSCWTLSKFFVACSLYCSISWTVSVFVSCLRNSLLLLSSVFSFSWSHSVNHCGSGALVYQACRLLRTRGLIWAEKNWRRPCLINEEGLLAESYVSCCCLFVCLFAWFGFVCLSFLNWFFIALAPLLHGRSCYTREIMFCTVLYSGSSPTCQRLWHAVGSFTVLSVCRSICRVHALLLVSLQSKVIFFVAKICCSALFPPPPPLPFLHLFWPLMLHGVGLVFQCCLFFTLHRPSSLSDTISWLPSPAACSLHLVLARSSTCRCCWCDGDHVQSVRICHCVCACVHAHVWDLQCSVHDGNLMSFLRKRSAENKKM